jgi:hypothetical protein
MDVITRIARLLKAASDYILGIINLTNMLTPNYCDTAETACGRGWKSFPAESVP